MFILLTPSGINIVKRNFSWNRHNVILVPVGTLNAMAEISILSHNMSVQQSDLTLPNLVAEIIDILNYIFISEN